ncbi:MAG: type I restriction enzyme HsdR N-terminal domain-containing protein, partial [Bacteroidaceae bacterium]|nr:type I restriction enzyme HsdR N-terminal domain-containing protein [Bacteroidaceae bacterium]
LVLKVDWLIVTNGLSHYCIRMDYDSRSWSFSREIPSYASIP